VNADPEARLDHSRSHRVSEVFLPSPPFRHAQADATCAEFIAAATRCVIEMSDNERQREI